MAWVWALPLFPVSPPTVPSNKGDGWKIQAVAKSTVTRTIRANASFYTIVIIDVTCLGIDCDSILSILKSCVSHLWIKLHFPHTFVIMFLFKEHCADHKAFTSHLMEHMFFNIVFWSLTKVLAVPQTCSFLCFNASIWEQFSFPFLQLVCVLIIYHILGTNLKWAKHDKNLLLRVY